jgi:hypothetical protein
MSQRVMSPGGNLGGGVSANTSISTVTTKPGRIPSSKPLQLGMDEG